MSGQSTVKSLLDQPKLSTRFWIKVQVAGLEECWCWTAARMKRRGKLWYGKFSVSRSHWTQAHRVAYELTHGPIPEGRHILHRCDNPACCNPTHLFDGSMLDNVADKVAKKRHRWKTHYGEEVGTHKLIASQVREIRNSFSGGHTRAALARKYGVSWTVVDQIVRRQLWTHVA